MIFRKRFCYAAGIWAAPAREPLRDESDSFHDSITARNAETGAPRPQPSVVGQHAAGPAAASDRPWLGIKAMRRGALVLGREASGR